MEIKTDATIYQWESDADFYLSLVVSAPDDKARTALLNAMRDRIHIKVTIELD